MRITIVIAGLTGGGAERVCVNLANAWTRRGHQVEILTLSQGPVAPAYAIESSVKGRDVGWPRNALPAELNAIEIARVLRGLHSAGCMEMVAEIGIIAILRYAILAEPPDVVVSHIDLTNIRVLAAMVETGVPVVACEHTDSEQFSLGRYQRARRQLYQQAAAVVAPHSTIAAWLATLGANAVAISNPLVAPPARGVAQNGGRRRLVTLSRLSEEKRLPFLLRAFTSIAEMNPIWDLEVYGEGPFRKTLLRLAGELATGRVSLRGFVQDPYAVLAGADLFVSSSWVEGFGNAIWEALACGVPVVAMDAGAPVRSLVRDGIDGIIVSENSEEALASALASLMVDEKRRANMATRAPEVVDRFSLETSLSAWDDVLARATQGK